MADRYLLRCDCGQDVIVEPRQAGQHVVCDCGQQLKAPSLRNLRELPKVAEEVAPSGGGWSFRQGVLTTGMLIAVGLVSWGGYLWANEPELPPAYNAAARDERFGEVVSSFSPSQAFLLWYQQYHLLARQGLEPMDDTAREVITRRVESAQWMRTSLFGAAGAIGLASLGAFLVLPKE